MVGTELETYDFLVNDEDEAMLLLYVREGEPANATIELDVENKTAILHRNENDHLTLANISDDVLDSMQDADKLMVCELSYEEDEQDTQIIFAYEAEITD